MAAVGQKNFQNFLYVDDNAVHWTKRGEDQGVRVAIDGSAAEDGSPTWIDSSRMRVRSVTFQDPTTFRTKRVIIYTAAAFAAITLGQVVAFPVEGEVTSIDYNATKKNGEKQPSRSASRQLADHA